MADQHDRLHLQDNDPDHLTARLDALGRAVLNQEDARSEPGRAYLEAVQRRAMFTRAPWALGLVAAAAMILVTAAILLNFGSPPAPRTLVNNPPAPDARQPAPTVAGLTALNRNIADPGAIRLGDASAPPATTTIAPSPRIGDAWRADRVEAVAGGR